MKKRFLYDFIIGGSMVAISLVVASLFSPVWGGVIAGLPIRLATTLGLIGFKGNRRNFQKVAKGCIGGMFGSVAFTFSLYLTLLSMGILLGFVISLLVCFAVIAVISVASLLIARE